VCISLSISSSLKLHRNPNHDTLIPAICSLLSSSASDDIISDQMVELIGLEDLDLVMMLLEKREISNQIVSSFLWGWFQVA